MAKDKNLEMFKLEDRVLFDAAAVVEIDEAASQQANNPNPNAQQSETDRQAQEDRETLKNAGPVDSPAAAQPDDAAPVYDGGIADVDAASEALINGDVGALSEYFDKPVMTRVTIDPASQASLSSLADDSLVVVDATLPGSESLLASAEQQGRDVLVLDADDGLDDVLAYLQGADKEYGSIHFFSHANKAGVIKLGADTITDADIQADSWRAIGTHLTDDGDILFYGCELGQNGAGRTVARQIAELADADVAVSDDVTGVHGDWDLEYRIGDVNHEVFVPDNYDYDLAATKIVTVEVAEDSDDYTYDGEDMNLREAIQVVNSDYYGTAFGFYEKGATDDDASLKYYDLEEHTDTDGNIDYFTLKNELGKTLDTFYAYETSEGKILYWNVEASAVGSVTDYASLKVLEVSYSGTSVSSFTIGKIETGTFSTEELGTVTMPTGNVVDKVSYLANKDFGSTYEIRFAGDARKEVNVLAAGLTITQDNVTVNGQGKAVIEAASGTSFSVFTNDATGLTLKGLEIAEAGKSAIYNKTGASLTIEDALLKNNSDAQNGGAVYNEAGAALNLKGAVFSGNESDYGAAIYLENGADLTAENATFAYNIADQKGGAVYLNAGTLTITDAYHFNANAADEAGGAIYAKTGTTLNIKGGEFTGNYELNPAASKGGAVYADGATVLNVTGGVFEGNLAGFHTADGKVLYVIDGTDFGVDGNLYREAEPTGDFFRVLTAEGKLVGLATVEGFVTLTVKETTTRDADEVETTVKSVDAAKGADGKDVSETLLAAIQSAFDASDAGQALFSATMGKALVGQGGAIYIGAGSELTTGAATFIGNAAKEGGALFAKRDVDVEGTHFEGNEAAEEGGAVYVDAVNFSVGDDSTFKNNAADRGGAVYTTETIRTVELDAALFEGNSALREGGAVYFADGVSAIALTETAFSGNTAANGGALYTPATAAVTFQYTTFVGNAATEDGGALYSKGSNYSFARENTFKENAAGADGGAIKLGFGSVATMTDMTFEGNTAGAKGGAVASDDAVLTVTNVVFAGNAATTGKGGAVHIVSGLNKDAIATFTDSTFSGNAADQGGALFLEMNEGTIRSVVKIDETSFTGNTAYSFGGAIYNGAGVKAVVKNSVFEANVLSNGNFDFETAMLAYVLDGSNDAFIKPGMENVFTATLAGAAIANAGDFTSYQNGFLANAGDSSSIRYYNNDKTNLIEYVKDEATGALILPEQTVAKDGIVYTLTRTSDTVITVSYTKPADPADPKSKAEDKSFTYTLNEKTGDIKCSDAENASLVSDQTVRNQLAYRNADGTVFTPEKWRDVEDDPATPKDESKPVDYWATGELGADKKADDVVIVQMKAMTAGGAFATIADGAVSSLVSNTLYDNAAGRGGAMYQGGIYRDGVLTRHHVEDGVIKDVSSTAGSMAGLQVNVVDTTIAGNTSSEEDGYAFQSLDGKAMFLNAVIAANRRGAADGQFAFDVKVHYAADGETVVYDVGEETDLTLEQVKDKFFAVPFETGTGDLSAVDKANLEILYSVVGEFGGEVSTADYVAVDANGSYVDASGAWLDAAHANVSVTAADVQTALWQALFVQYEKVDAGVKSAADSSLLAATLAAKQLLQNQADVAAWYESMTAAVEKLYVENPKTPSDNDGYDYLKGLFDTFKTTKLDGVADAKTLRANAEAFIVELESATAAQGSDNASMTKARAALKDALLKTAYVETDVSVGAELGGDYGAAAMFDLVFGKTKEEATAEIDARSDGEARTYDDIVVSVDNLQAEVTLHGLTDDERSNLDAITAGADFTADRATNYIGTDATVDDGTFTARTYDEGEEAPVDAFGVTTTEKSVLFALTTDSTSLVSISPAAYYQSALVKVSTDNEGAVYAISFAKPVVNDTAVVYDGAPVERARASEAQFDSAFGGTATDLVDVDQRNFSSNFFNYTRGSWWQDAGAKLVEALVVTQKGHETGWNTSNGLTFSELIYGIEKGIVAANLDLDRDGIYEGYKITFDESLFTDGKYTLTVNSAYALTGKEISQSTGEPLFAEGSSYNLVIDGGSDPARELTIEAGTACDFIDATNAALAFNLQLQHLTIKGFKNAVKVNGTDGTKAVTNYYDADGKHQKLYSTITIEDTTITGSAEKGIDLNKGSVYVIGASAFTDNAGGAISVGAGQVVLGIAEGVDIEHTVTYGTADTITFSGNTAAKGAAICVTEAAFDADSTWQLNQHDAGVYMEGVQSIVFLNNAATSAKADEGGGAIWADGGVKITANQIDIIGNSTLSNKGGSIYATGDVSLQLYGSSRLSTISGNSVTGTTEAKGGAIYAGGKVTIGSKAAGAFFNIDDNHVKLTATEGNLVAQGGAVWGSSIDLKDVTSVVGNSASGAGSDSKVSGNLVAQGGAFYAAGNLSVSMTIAEVEGYWSDNSVSFTFADGSTGSVALEGAAAYAGGDMLLSDVYAYKNFLVANLGANGARTAAISIVGGFAAAKGDLVFYSGEVSQSSIKVTASGALKNAKIAGGALYAGKNLTISHTTNTLTNNAPGSGVGSNGITVDLTATGSAANLSNVVISGGAAHAEGDADIRNAKIEKNFVNLAARSDGTTSALFVKDTVVQGGAVAGKGGTVNDSAFARNYLVVDANGGSTMPMKLQNFSVLGGALALGAHATAISNVYAEDNYIEAKLKAKRIATYDATGASEAGSTGFVVRGGQLYAGGTVTGSRLTVIGSGAADTIGIQTDGSLGKKNNGFNNRDWFNLTAEGGGAYFGGKTTLSNASFVDNDINVDLLGETERTHVGNINLHGGQLAVAGDLTIKDTLAPMTDANGDPLITPSKIVNARNAAIRLSGTSFVGGMIDTIDVRGGGAYATGNVEVSQYATAKVGDYTIDISGNDINVDIDSWAGDVTVRNNGMGLFAEMAMQMLAGKKFDLEFGVGTDSMDGAGVDLGSFGDTKVGGWIEDALNAALKLLNGMLDLSRFNFSIDHTNVEGGGIYGGGTMKLAGVDATNNRLDVSYRSAFRSGTTRFILDDMNVLGAGVASMGDLTVSKSTFNNNAMDVEVISDSSGGTVFSAAFGILGIGKTSTSAGLAMLHGLNAQGGGAYTAGALKADSSAFNGNAIDVNITCSATKNTASGLFTWLDAVPGFAGILLNMINNGVLNVDSDALLWTDYVNAEGGGAYAGSGTSVITDCTFVGNTISSDVLATTADSSAVAFAIVTRLQYLTETQKLGIGHTIDGVNSETVATADADVIVETYNVRGGGFYTDGTVNFTQNCTISGNKIGATLIADARGGCVTASSTYLQTLMSNTLKPAETFIIRLGAEATAHKDAYVDELRSITAYVPVLPLGGGGDGFIWRVDKGFYGRPMVQGPFYMDGASGWWMLDGATFVVQGAGFDAATGYNAGTNPATFVTANIIEKAEAKAILGCVPMAITSTAFILTQLPGVPYPLMVPTIFTVDIDIEVAEAHECAYNYFHDLTSYGQFKDCFKVGDDNLDVGYGTTVCDRVCWAGRASPDEHNIFYVPGITITTLPLHGFQIGGFVIPIPWVSMVGPAPMVFMNLVVPPMGIWATYTSNGLLYLPMTPAACAAALIDLGMNAAVALVANSVVSAVTNIGGFCEGAVPGTAVATGASTGGDASGASSSAGASVGTDGTMSFKQFTGNYDSDGNPVYADVEVDLAVLALVAQAAGITITNGSAVNTYDAEGLANGTYADEAARKAAEDKATTKAREVKNETEDETIVFGSVHDDGADTDTVTIGDKTLVWNVGENKWQTTDGDDVTDEAAVLPTLSDGSACFTLKNDADAVDGKIYLKYADGSLAEVTADLTFTAKSLDGTTAFWDAAASKWITADDAADTVTLNADGTISLNTADAEHVIGTEGVRIYTLDGADYWYDLTGGTWIDALPEGYRAVNGETGFLDADGDQVMAKSASANTWVNLTTGELYGTRETKVVYATDATPGKVVTTYNTASGKVTEEIALDPAGTGVTVNTYDANLNPIVTEVAANGDLKSTFHDLAKHEYNVTETSTLAQADGSYTTTNKCSTYGENGDAMGELKDVTYVTTFVEPDAAGIGQMDALQQITRDVYDGSDSKYPKETYEVEGETVFLDKNGQVTDKDHAYESKTLTETFEYSYEIWHVNSMYGFADGSSQTRASEVQKYWHYVDEDGADCYVACEAQVPADTASDEVYLLVAEAAETVSPSYTDEQLGYIGSGDYYENGDGYQYIHETANGSYEVDGKHYEFKVEGSHVENHWKPLYDPFGDPFICEGFDPETGTTGIDRTTGYPEGVLCKVTTKIDSVETGETTVYNGEVIAVTKQVSSTAVALVGDTDGHQIHVSQNADGDWIIMAQDDATGKWTVETTNTFVNSGGNPIVDGDGCAIIMSTDMYGKAPTEDGYVGPMTTDGRPAVGYGEADSNIAFTYDKDGNIDTVIWVGEGYTLLEPGTADGATANGLGMFYDVVVGQTVTEVIEHPFVPETYVNGDPEQGIATPAVEAWTEVKTEDVVKSYFIDADGNLRLQDGDGTFTYDSYDYDADTGTYAIVTHTTECSVLMRYVLVDHDGTTSAEKTVVYDADNKPIVAPLKDGESIIQIGEDASTALYVTESNYGVATTTEGYVGPATWDGEAASVGDKGNVLYFDAEGKVPTQFVDESGVIPVNRDLKVDIRWPSSYNETLSNSASLAGKAIYVQTKVETVVIRDPETGDPVLDESTGEPKTKDVTYLEIIADYGAEKTGSVEVQDYDMQGQPAGTHMETVSYCDYTAVDTFDRDVILGYKAVVTDAAGKATFDSTTHEITTENAMCELTAIETTTYNDLYKADAATLTQLGVAATDTVIVEVDAVSGKMQIVEDAKDPAYGKPSNLLYDEEGNVEKDNCGHVIYKIYKGQKLTVRTYEDGSYIFDDAGGATYTASVNGYNVIFTTGDDGLVNVAEGGLPTEVESKSVKTEVTVSKYSDSQGDHSTTSTSVDVEYTAVTDSNGNVVYGDGTTLALTLKLPEETSTGPDKTVNTSYTIQVPDNVAAYLVLDETTGKVQVAVAQDLLGNAVYENAATLDIVRAQQDEVQPPTQPDQEPVTVKKDVTSADDKEVWEIKPFDEDGLSVYFKDYYGKDHDEEKAVDAAAGYEKVILTDELGNALKAKDADGNDTAEDLVAYKNLRTGFIYNGDGIVLNVLTDGTGAVVYDVPGLKYADAEGDLICDSTGSVVYTAESLSFGGVTVTNAHVEVGVNGQVVTRALVDFTNGEVVKVPTCLMMVKTPAGEKFACNTDGSAIYTALDADGNRYLDADGSPSNVYTDASGEPILDSTGHAVYIALDQTGEPQLDSNGKPLNVANVDDLADQPVQYFATNALGRIVKDRAGNRILIESDPETNQPMYDDNHLPTNVLKRANGSMVYDAAGNVIYLTTEQGLAVWTAYDAEGNEIVSELNDAGETVWKQYDGDTVVVEEATFDHYENTKLLTADALVDNGDGTGTLDLGSYGTKSLVQNKAGVWFVDINGDGTADPKDMRLETQTLETDHGVFMLISDGYGNVLYRDSAYDGTVKSRSGAVQAETLATPYDSTSNVYALTAAEQADVDAGRAVYVTMASGSNDPTVEGTLAWALANANGKTIKFADGLFTGGKAVILVEDTISISENVAIDAGTNADGSDREVVIRTPEPGLWFGAGYQDDSQTWIEANGRIDEVTKVAETPVCYVYAPAYALFDVAADVTSISATNITFEGGHVSDAGAVFTAAGTRANALKLELDGSNIFRSNADNGGGAIYVNGDIDIVLADNAQIAVNNAGEGGAVKANGAVTVEGDGMFVRNTAETADGGAVSARGSVKLEGDVKFVANEAAGNGGAVYAVARNGSFKAVDGVEFAFNTAENGQGGAVYFKTTDGATTFSIDGASFLANEAAKDGGAVYAEAATRDNRMDINESVFTDNAAGATGSGGAIFYATKGTLSGVAGAAEETFINADNTRFDSNEAGAEGGAVKAEYGRVTLKGENTLVTDGYADVGGGLAVGGVLTVGKGVVFEGNTAKSNGGAIAIDAGQLSVTGVTFESNTSHANGGAIALLADALSATIVSSSFMVNTAKTAGAAIYSNAEEALIVNRKSTFNANSVGVGKGGAVAIDGGEYQATGNIYFANRAGTDGGAIAVTGENASAVVKSVKFYDNVAGDAGGAVYAGEGADVVVSNAIFGSGKDVGYVTSTGLGNTADKGGALAVESGATISIGNENATGSAKTKIANTTARLGGAIYVDGGNLKSNETLILDGNKAVDGAAIYATTDNASEASIELNGKTEITGSTASEKGTVYLDGDATLAFNGETTISGNEAQYGGAIYFAGSSHVDFNALTLVTDNTASESGAAFYVGSSGEFTIDTKLVTVRGNHGTGTFYIGKTTEANFNKASFIDETGSDYIVVEGYLAFNRSSVDGGGIRVLDGGKLAIANSTITESKDWGILLEAGAEAAIVNTTVALNNLDGEAGGLKIAVGADALVLNSIFVANGTQDTDGNPVTYDIAGKTRGGSVYYTTAENDADIANQGKRNVVGKEFSDTFYSSGLHKGDDGTYYYVPQTLTKAQQRGSRVKGGVEETSDGSGVAVYLDKKAGSHEGVVNKFAGDIDYDQRGFHRTVLSFGAAVEFDQILNEDTVSASNNNNFTVMNGIKAGGLKPTHGEVLSNQADVRAAAGRTVMYGTNGGMTAYVTPASVIASSDVKSGYVFSSFESSVMLDTAHGRDVLGEGIGDASFGAGINGLLSFADGLVGSNAMPIGRLTKVESFRSGFESAMEELLGE